MAARVREHDWAATALGPIEAWPPELKAAVTLVLDSAFPAALVWGEDLVTLYNDGFAPILGDKPDALGRSFADIWAEAWEEIGPVARRAYAGEATYVENFPLTVDRFGRLEQAYFTFSYSPVRRGDGRVCGMIDMVTETSAAVAAMVAATETEERQTFLLKLSDELRPLADPIDIARAGLSLLRRYLHLDRAYVAQIAGADHPVVVLAEESDANLPPMPPQLRPADVPEGFKRAAEGLLVVDDVTAEPGFGDLDRRSLEAIALAGFVVAPLHRGAEGMVWALVAGMAAPRSWRRAEAMLVAESAERLCGAMELARSSAALRDREARHRLLIGSWAQAVWEASADGVVVADSPSWRAYTGQTFDEWLGYGWLDAIHPDDRAYAERQWREAVAAKSLVDAEFRLRAPDGDWRWTNVRAAPVLDDGGRIERWVGMNVDIDVRRRAEAVLRESEERQAFLLALRDALRPLADAGDITGVATRLLAERLGVSRCYYAEWPAGANHGLIARDYAAAGVASLAGRYPIEAFRSAYDRVAQGRTWVVEDNATAEGISDAERRHHQAIGVIAWVDVPLVKGGRPVAVLCLVDGKPRRWTAEEIELVEETAERLWGAVERARVEAALRRSEGRLRALFESIDEGFSEMQVILDEEGHVVDWLHLALNGNFSRVTGIPDITGRLASEVFPNLEGEWFRRMDLAYRTGEPQRFETELAELGRWFDNYITRLGGEGDDRVFGVFGDITERKTAERTLRESEERQAFLLEFNDAMRPLRDAREVLTAAVRLLGQHLSVNRVAFYEIEADENAFSLGAGWTDGLPPLPDRMLITDYGEGIHAEYLAGRSMVVRDIDRDALAESNVEAIRAIDVRAWMAIPLVKDGRLVAILGLHSVSPRDWTRAETRLVEEVADRTWAAVERSRAETALRESEDRQAFLLGLSDALRPIADPIEVQRVATRALGEQLGASRVFYVLVEQDGETATIHDDYTNGVPSRAGRYRLSDFSSSGLDDWRAGRIGSTDDVQADPRYDEAERRAYASVMTRAGFGVPLVKEGRLAAVLGVNQSAPRRWTPQEFDLTREVADRTWAAVERARVQTELRKSEERLRQFGEASQDVLWVRDAETFQWEYLTPAFEAIYGLERDVALAGDNMANWLALVVPEDRALAAESLARVRHGEWVTFAYRIRRPSDGEVRWLRNTDFPMGDSSGRVARIGGVGHDVTELKRTEEALAAAELRQRALLEGMPQLVWRAVDGGEWTWASPQWSEFTGQAELDSHGRGWLDALHPDDRDKARAAWAEAMDRGGMDAEYRICHSDEGSYRWFHTRASPVRDERGHIVEWLGTSTDIHDLREMQERQKVLVAELQHRTRNLMGVVRAMSDKTVRASADLPDFRVRFRDRLDALARVQGLLSRLNEHDRVTFDELIRAELEAMNGNADRISLEGPSGVRLRSSMVQTLAMAVHELATNAVKYGALGQPGARLTVSWALEPDDSGDRSRLHIDWRETGVVMPPPGAKPTGGGQGRELIERALPYQLSAETTYELGPDGVHCSISIPISRSTLPEDVEHV